MQKKCNCFCWNLKKKGEKPGMKKNPCWRNPLLNILVDSRSTYKFLDCDIVSWMRWIMEQYRPVCVSLANGNLVQINMICKGVEWLLLRNCSKLIFSYYR